MIQRVAAYAIGERLFSPEGFGTCLPLVLPSTANLREHYFERGARASQHRGYGRLLANTVGAPRALKRWGRVKVRLVRQAPRPLDDDNLRSALKAFRDGVADSLGVPDNDPRIAWEYFQRKGEPVVQLEVLRDSANPAHLRGTVQERKEANHGREKEGEEGDGKRREPRQKEDHGEKARQAQRQKEGALGVTGRTKTKGPAAGGRAGPIERTNRVAAKRPRATLAAGGEGGKPKECMDDAEKCARVEGEARALGKDLEDARRELVDLRLWALGRRQTRGDAGELDGPGKPGTVEIALPPRRDVDLTGREAIAELAERPALEVGFQAAHGMLRTARNEDDAIALRVTRYALAYVVDAMVMQQDMKARTFMRGPEAAVRLRSALAVLEAPATPSPDPQTVGDEEAIGQLRRGEVPFFDGAAWARAALGSSSSDEERQAWASKAADAYQRTRTRLVKERSPTPAELLHRVGEAHAAAKALGLADVEAGLASALELAKRSVFGPPEGES